jgi:cytochrome c oxidase subunit 3
MDNMLRRHHTFHILKNSIWPFLLAAAILFLVISLISIINENDIPNKNYSFFGSILFFFLIFSQWVRDMIREKVYLKKHTAKVKRGLSLGFVLFIISEICFFFSFFWSLFHNKLNPAIELGCVWPPYGLTIIPITIPLANTLILLTSGATITLVHIFIKTEKKQEAISFFFLTLLLSIIFLSTQLYEYKNAPFSISDGVYGSIFFMLTGFHGMHVIVGTIMITIQCFRYIVNQYNEKNHIGFETAAWYWHFVDVVWLFLFLFLYINL